jgi:hypothetical protein
MKSRLATYMNLGRRILVFTLLAVIVTAAAGMQSAPAISSAEARKAIQARVALDKSTIERMLAPDVCVQTPDQKLTGQELIDAIFSHPYTLTRFDATVLTVEPRANEWAALVLEKLEGEIKDNSGKTSEIYVMAVARDGWGKLNDNEWTLLWSEQLGQQQWKDERPPIANW